MADVNYLFAPRLKPKTAEFVKKEAVLGLGLLTKKVLPRVKNWWAGTSSATKQNWPIYGGMGYLAMQNAHTADQNNQIAQGQVDQMEQGADTNAIAAANNRYLHNNQYTMGALAENQLKNQYQAPNWQGGLGNAVSQFFQPRSNTMGQQAPVRAQPSQGSPWLEEIKANDFYGRLQANQDLSQAAGSGLRKRSEAPVVKTREQLQAEQAARGISPENQLSDTAAPESGRDNWYDWPTATGLLKWMNPIDTDRWQVANKWYNPFSNAFHNEPLSKGEGTLRAIGRGGLATGAAAGLGAAGLSAAGAGYLGSGAVSGLGRAAATRSLSPAISAGRSGLSRAGNLFNRYTNLEFGGQMLTGQSPTSMLFGRDTEMDTAKQRTDAVKKWVEANRGPVYDSPYTFAPALQSHNPPSQGPQQSYSSPQGGFGFHRPRQMRS